MLTHSIKKYVTTPVVNNVAYPKFDRSAYAPKCMWDKVQYAKWVETVKAKYKVGDYLCINHSFSYADNRVPFWYKIVDINEIHYTCDWDNYHNEPACLSVISELGIVMKKCPTGIRKLTDEEVERVHLQNPAPAALAKG